MTTHPKVALITLHRVHNFGSALQTVATQRLLERHGASVEVIDYWRPSERDDIPSQIRHNFRRWDQNIATRAAFNLLRGNGLQRQSASFRSFLESYVNLTAREFHSERELEAHAPTADIYCVGSDQVWNDDYHVDGSDPFYLKFAPSGARRISLASSFGKTHLTPAEMDYVDRYLPAFDALSVRESSAVGMLRERGLSATHVVDPTLAEPPDTWRNLALEPNLDRPYVLVYQLHRSQDLSPLVNYVRRLGNLDVVTIRGYWEPRDPKGLGLTNVSVQQFLGLFTRAAHVVTDSFHGTAFALNFGIPVNPVYPPNYGERIRSLLAITGTTDRAVTDVRNIQQSAFVDFDVDHVTRQLHAEREHINSFVAKALRF